MNERVDLNKILKYCPKGWEFYSSIHGVVYFEELNTSDKYPVIISYKNGKLESFGADGRLFLDYAGECVLLPSKDQRDWSKFTAPWYNGGVNTEKKLDKNDVHYYVARDKGGIIWLFMGKPIRRTEFFSCPYGKLITNADADEFSNYGLNVRDFDNLKWEDDPVEVFINLED